MVIHAIWVDDDDIALMADAGCVVAHNPICNLKLGSGIMPFRKLRDAGIPIALGSDERAADDTTDMWAVAKMASLIHRVTDPDYLRWPEPREILQCRYARRRARHAPARRSARLRPASRPT